MNNTDKNENKVKLSFSALNPFVEKNIPEPVQKTVRGQNFVAFGDDNRFPGYLFSCYRNVSLLQTLIDGCKDYICGNGIENNTLPMSDEEVEELLDQMSLSYLIYGGFFLNVLRNKMGKVCKVVCLDYRKVRTDENLENFFYSEDFESKSYGRGKYIELPKFERDSTAPSSVYFFRRDKFETYPLPLWGASLTAVELQREINNYHLNSIKNQFNGGTMVSLCNGVPTDEVQKEIEKGFNEKFCGTENAQRLVIAYSDDIQHAPKIQKIETEDFGQKYQTLADRSQQELFCAFRATPNLFGIPTETTGFDTQEYTSAYALFYDTMIKPIQRKFIKAIGKIYSVDAPFEIVPFKVDFEDGEIENAEE